MCSPRYMIVCHHVYFKGLDGTIKLSVDRQEKIYALPQAEDRPRHLILIYLRNTIKSYLTNVVSFEYYIPVVDSRVSVASNKRSVSSNIRVVRLV